MIFGKRIRELRKQKGISQADLAAALGVSTRTVQGYESGRRLPKKQETYQQIASHFGVSVDSLMSESEQFVTEAAARYGTRGATQAQALISEVSGLFSGGTLAEEDMDEMMRAIQDAYWIAKEKNRKYIPDGYRDPQKADSDA